MSFKKMLACVGIAAQLISISTLTLAGPGHDHGAAQTTERQASLPRVSMSGELTEAVLTLGQEGLTLYLDYLSNNIPVKNATISLLVNDAAITWREREPGRYTAPVTSTLLSSNNLNLTGSIETNGFTEYLSATLSIHGEHGHDDGAHDHEARAVADMPYRLADGSVFFPKISQHQLSLRTQTTKLGKVPNTVALNGKVAIDPHTGGLVQTITGGHFEPASKGVPKLGQAVRKDEVLGYLHTHAEPLEQANNKAQIAKLQADINQVRQRLYRLEQLADSTPRKLIDDTKASLLGKQQQLKALQQGLEAREPLVSPTTGVIASTRAIAGKVFNPGDVVFEVINPRVLRVEANWYEPGGAPEFQNAYIQARGEPIEIEYQGAAGSLVNQAMTLVFEAHFDQPKPFALGQLLTLYAQTEANRRGIALPQHAIVKNTANQTIVWVKAGAETLQPRAVVTEPYNGNEVLVVTGLQAGERVVTDGANLVNQIR